MTEKVCKGGVYFTILFWTLIHHLKFTLKLQFSKTYSDITFNKKFYIFKF